MSLPSVSSILGYDGVPTFFEDLADLITKTIGERNGHISTKPSNTPTNPDKSSMSITSSAASNTLSESKDTTQMPNTRSTSNCLDIPNNGTSCEQSMVKSMVKLMSSKCNEINSHDIDSGIDSCDEKKKKSKSNLVTGSLIDQSSVQNGRGRLVRCRNVISNSTQVSL